jgi:hypothetical protein
VHFENNKFCAVTDDVYYSPVLIEGLNNSTYYSSYNLSKDGACSGLLGWHVQAGSGYPF